MVIPKPVKSVFVYQQNTTLLKKLFQRSSLKTGPAWWRHVKIALTLIYIFLYSTSTMIIIMTDSACRYFTACIKSQTLAPFNYAEDFPLEFFGSIRHIKAENESKST